MALDNTKNFAKVTVSTGYSSAATSIVLSSGNGALLPTASFNLTWWNSTDYADPSDDPNVEIVRCTNISTDTLTVTRAQESTSASAKNTAGKTYKMIAGITAKVINTDAPATFESQANKDQASGYAGLDSSGLLKVAEFPSPTSSTFGGVKALAAVSNEFLTSIGTNGVPVAAQPSSSNLSDVSTVGPTVFETAGYGFFSAYFGHQPPPAGGAFAFNPVVAYCYLTQVLVPLTIRKVTISVTTLDSTGGAFVDVALFSAAGTSKLLDTSSISVAAVAVVTTTLGSAVTILPGIYVAVITSNSSVCRIEGAVNTLYYSSNGIMNQNTVVRSGSVTTSSGAIPSSVATRAAFTVAGQLTPPCVLFES